MARLPTPGSDNGTWGNVLNDYLLQTLKSDGTLKDNAVTASNLAPNSVTNSALASNAVNASIIADGSITETLLDSALQAKVNASSGSVTSVAGKTGAVTLDKSDIGLSNVDNTSDATKNSASATLTNKTLDGASNTLQNIPQSAITNLTSNLSDKVSTSSATRKIYATDNSGAQITIDYRHENAPAYTMVRRDADGAIVAADPTTGAHVATKNYVDTNAITASGAATLTNKTLNNPRLNNTILDNNGNALIRSDAWSSSAVNYLGVETSPSGANYIQLNALGSDTNISLSLKPAGTGEVQIFKDTGNVATLLGNGLGSDIDLNLRTKGLGKVRANGVEIVTLSDTQTVSNKILSNPRIGEILDATNGKTAFATHAAANAVNFIYSYGNNSGESPQLAVSGGDTNVHLDIVPKGTGHLRVNTLTGNTSIISAEGPGTNQNLDLLSKGTGEVRANGARIITDSMLTDYSQLVCLTAPGATGADDGSDTWAKIVTFSTGTTQYAEAQLVLSVANRNSGQHDTAIVSAYFRTNSTGQDPIVDVKILAKGGDGVGIRNDSFKVISGGWSTDMELWMKKGGTYGRFAFYETSKNLEGGTLIYTSNAPWQSTTPVGPVNNVSSNGVQSGLSLRVNGSLSVSNGIKDTNGNPSLDLGTIPNAVNRIYIDNQSTGNYPTIGATGPDADIGLALAPKNNGPVNLFGNAPTIAAAGGANGGNLNLNLKSQGTGVVQANGNPVTTSKMKYPMYADSSTYFEPWPQLMCYGGNWVLASGDLPLTFFTPAVNMTVSNIITMGWNDTTHTNATDCRVAIYRVDDVFSGGNKMECIARSGHKADRWNGSVLDSAPIVDNGAASPSAISSVNLIAGQQYAVGYMSIGHTGTPKLSALGTFRKNTLLPHVGYFGDGGHSSMPVYVTSGWLEEWTFIWFALS